MNKKPAPGRRKRRTVAEKTQKSETSDDDGFSSTNTAKSRRSRSKSIEVGKKAPRGRPRKNPAPVIAPAAVVAASAAVTTVKSPPPKTTTPKKETAKKQTTAARARNVRQNSNVKSRATVSTDTSSSDEEDATPKAKVKANALNNARLPIVSPRQQSLATNQNYLSSPTNRSPALRSPALRSIGVVSSVVSNARNHSISPAAGRLSSASHSKLSSSSSDDDEDEKAQHAKKDELKKTGKSKLPAHQNSSSIAARPGLKNDTNVTTRTKSNSDDEDDDDDDDEDDSDSDKSDANGSSSNSDSSSSDGSDESVKDNKDVNKAKSDKKKNDTLRKLFSWGTKGEGGAKGKGQVLIVDHSEDAQQQSNHPHAQLKENSIPNEKLTSPYSQNSKHTSNAYTTNNNVLVNGTTTDVSPLKSSNVNHANKSLSHPIICKIDLMRLARVPQDRSFRLHRDRSPLNAEPSGRRSTLHFQKRDEDRLSTGRSPIDYGYNGTAGGRRSRNRNVGDDETNGRMSNSRDSSSSSTTTSSKHRDGENGNTFRNNSNSRFESINESNAPNKHNSSTSSSGNGSFNTVIHNNIDSRVASHSSGGDAGTATQRNSNYIRSPKLDEKPMGKIKRESLKNEFSNNDYAYGNNAMTSPKQSIDEKSRNANFNSKLNYDTNSSSNNIKRENIKTEPPYVDNNVPEETNNKMVVGDGFVGNNNRKKRSSSANSSPYKDKKRKKIIDDAAAAMEPATMPPTNNNHRSDANLLPPPQKPLLTKVYVSYFERTNDERDEIR